MISQPKSFHDLAVTLREEPQVYLGPNNKKSFVALISFIKGLYFTEESPEFTEFLEWIKNNVTPSQYPFDYIQDRYEDKAVRIFWEYYDRCFSKNFR
ncbi:MAG: hypothetical protein NE334_15445 [Lentisphaeraceae bacterium]|nr:hypothetical protein [Lentisphaeraceae bacterium]